MNQPEPDYALEGWRLYIVDASIEGSFSVMLVRSDGERERWLELSDEHREKIPLYVSATGSTLRDGRLAARRLAMDTPGVDDA